MSTRRFAYLGLGGAAVLALLTAAPAAAHVTVQPGGATRGSFAKLAFRVPNESETAGTVKLEVRFPVTPPVASLRTKPMAGWTAEVRREKLATSFQTGESEITEAVRTIVWTAQPGVRIGPGEFTEFEVSGGPLPDADQLILPAVQTYDDGTVVSWDAPPPASGGDEPEHPAPLLKLVAQPAANGAGAESSPQQATGTRDDTARWLGGVGLAAGALGIGLAAGTLLASRRGRAPGAPAGGGAPTSGEPG